MEAVSVWNLGWKSRGDGEKLAGRRARRTERVRDPYGREEKPRRQGEEAKREKESRSLGIEREWTG